MKFEFTARNTLQQNSKAEKGFDVLYGQGRAVMQAAIIPMEMRYKLFCKAFHHVTKLDNLVVTTINQKMATRYEHFGEELAKFVNSTRTWSKVGVVSLKCTSSPRDTVCIFVGYLDMHAAD